MVTFEFVEKVVQRNLQYAQMGGEIAKMWMHQTFGAVQFACELANVAGKAHLGARILDAWNNQWNKEFFKLIK